MYEERSEAKKEHALAISLGEPKRPNAILDFHRLDLTD